MLCISVWCELLVWLFISFPCYVSLAVEPKYLIIDFAAWLQEAFIKIREQAKAYLEMKGELTSGLNLINSTNLEYFAVKHKAEIFRLRGDFLLKLNDSENANIAYSNAVTLFKNLPKGWISWGNYCDMVT